MSSLPRSSVLMASSLPGYGVRCTGQTRDMSSVLWLRRDLRLRDHPALHEAAHDGPVVALFVLDPALLKPAGAPRIAFLYRTLRALDADLDEHGGRLLVRRGDPVTVVPKV